MVKRMDKYLYILVLIVSCSPFKNIFTTEETPQSDTQEQPTLILRIRIC